MSDHASEPSPETDEAEVSHHTEGWATPEDAVIDSFDGEDDEAEDASEATVVSTGIPTQIAHPAKATARTGFAVVIGSILTLFLLAPSIIEAIAGVDGLPEWVYPSLATIGGTLTIISLVITRLMQIPQINDLLSKIKLGTGVETE